MLLKLSGLLAGAARCRLFPLRFRLRLARKIQPVHTVKIQDC